MGEVAKEMRFDELQCPVCQMQPCIAIRTEEAAPVDQGVTDGLRWLSSAVAKDYADLDARVERDIVIQQEKEREQKERRKAELKKRRAEREAREAAEAAEAEAAVMAANEATQVAVPLKICANQQGEEGVGLLTQAEGKCAKLPETCSNGEAPAATGKVESSEGASEAPVTPEKIKADQSVSVETPGGPGTCLEALPSAPAGTLPPVKAPKAPPRLEPIPVTPDKAAIHGIIHDSPTTVSPGLSISNHPNVPPSPAYQPSPVPSAV